MPVQTLRIQLETRGDADIVNITGQVESAAARSGIHNGTITIFTPSATSSITTIEYETGCLNDFCRLLDEILPPDRPYQHNARWGDGNGHAHIRAALLGPSLTIPLVDRKPVLGNWQQVIFIDFDNRPRRRELLVQIVGE